ncbi:MAG TPA: hypothetical protein VIN71_03640, partial [Pseudomonadales bacterium]
SHLERLVPANHLFYKDFKVISKLVHTDCVHKASFMYGNAVQLYTKSLGKTKHSDRFFVAPSAPQKKQTSLQAAQVFENNQKL